MGKDNMYFKVDSGNVLGMNSHLIEVESDVSEGMPSIELVGFLSSEVREAKERVRTALKNNGFVLPARRITINLSPADIKKYGTGFDLPIAISILGCMGQLEASAVEKTLFIGELGLNGELRSVAGVLPRVLMARENGYKQIILPSGNYKEGAIVDGIKVYGFDNLMDVLGFLRGERQDTIIDSSMQDFNTEKSDLEDALDFSMIRGQNSVKRAMEIAASGLHNILIVGPPGAGKTMCAKALPSILPPLSLDESLEISKIYSVAGLLKEKTIKLKHPFVDPHHTVSQTAMSGGGNYPKPGAVSLAHGGVLFLDEFPEYRKETLEVLRQPLESKEIVICRNNLTLTFPADFMLVAAMNPCKCGYFPDRNRCNCAEEDVKRYVGRISGPLVDRIDICVRAKEIRYDELLGALGKEESSADIRKRVCAARQIQSERFKNEKIKTNSHMNSAQIEMYCPLGERESNILREVFTKLKLTARSYHKIIKTARTIADLEQSKEIKEKHLLEAVGYRGIYEL